MTYINIAIIVTLVLFDLIMLKFVWIILKSEKVNQLEAAVTSFALICAAVVMTYTSAVTIVYADEPSKWKTQYINGHTYHKYGSKKYSKVSHSKYHNKYRKRSTRSATRPRIMSSPLKR